MNEKMNYPAKWLQYLLYVQIAALAISLIGYIPLVGSVTRWLTFALNIATAYLLFRLADVNPRYKTAAIFCAASLILGLMDGTVAVLAVSVCSIIAEYQEYHGHGELLEQRDPRLAGKWNFLFWLQLIVTLILSVLTSIVTVILTLLIGFGTAVTTAITTVVISILSFALRLLYLAYLHRTVKRLENEFVM